MQTVKVDLGLESDSKTNPLANPTYPNDPDHGEVVGQERGRDVFYFPGSNGKDRLRVRRDGAALMCGDTFQIRYQHTTQKDEINPRLEVKAYPWGEAALARAESLLETYQEQINNYLLPEEVIIPEELDFEPLD